MTHPSDKSAGQAKVTTSTCMGRRAFVAGVAAGASILATPAIAARPGIPPIDLYNPHTGETLRRTMVERGRWINESLYDLSHFVRDWREDISIPIDPKVALTLLKIRMMIEPSQPTVILSGYRTPKTNARISGTARNSLHLRAMALDIRQPGVSIDALHRAATALDDGGVGKYSSQGFIHIDSGRVRHWGT